MYVVNRSTSIALICLVHEGRQGLSVKPWVDDSGPVSSDQRAQRPLVLGLLVVAMSTQHLSGFWVLNSDPRVCEASALSTVHLSSLR